MRSSVHYEPPVEDILQAIQANRWCSDLDGFELALDDGLVSEVVRGFARVAADKIAPSDAVGDLQVPELQADGRVAVPVPVANAHAAFVEGGWAGVALHESIGGAGFGPLVGLAILEMYGSANLGLSLNPLLTAGAIDLLAEWATPDQRERYLEPLVSGAWSATMCLTEPDAGSDVGAVRTKASLDSDGAWRVTGTKIFITWGEHDLSDNILHLVLARTENSQPGTRGISLFAVPRHLPDGQRNGVRCVGLERKLGIHASPTCSLEFDGAFAELIGQEGGGLRAMFTMMNAARLAVGLQGVAIGQRAYDQARAYAQERRQGRGANGDPAGSVIAHHPDVRRMLTDLRSTTRAMRLLLHTVAAESALAKHGRAASQRQVAGRRVNLLTPAAKGWCTDEGVRLASVSLQVHGGVGYVEETGIAQRYRDARIAPIYEGTNGIQAADLALRKVRLDDGEAIFEHIRAMRVLLERSAAPELEDAIRTIGDSLNLLLDAATWIVTRSETELPDVLAGSVPFMRLLAVTTAGALSVGHAGRARLEDRANASELTTDARFFAAHRVGGSAGLVSAICAGETVLGVWA